MIDNGGLWTVPFLLGFGCGMLAAMISALTWVASIEATVVKAMGEIKALVSGIGIKESARTGDSFKL